jgi:predicted permease
VKQIDLSYPDFEDWLHSAQSFEQMFAITDREYNLTGPGTLAHLTGMEVSQGCFATLGVKLQLGRDFLDAEDSLHGAPAAIVSDRLWRERFAASPQALGKTLVLDGVETTIVGVLPQRFRLLEDADVYTSLKQSEPLYVGDRTIHDAGVIARLNPGVSIGEAQAELSAIQANLDQLYPMADRNLGAGVTTLKQEIVGDTRATLLMLLGAVCIVLLIACTNVANLLLALAAARTREFGIRAALGANRARMVRQLLTESALLALASGALGVTMAQFAVKLLLAAFPQSLPRVENIGVNLPVLMFAFGISLAVGLVFGVAPALRSSRVDVQSSLKEGDRGSARVHSRGQGAMVMVQMALTLVLLVGAGLLLRTIRDLSNVNPGFNTHNVIAFKVGLSPALTATPSSTRLAYRQLLDRIRQIPGVQGADFTNVVPLAGENNTGPFWVGAQQSTSMQDAPHALYFEPGPDYLNVMQIPLLQGRFFTAADNSDSEPVVVIDSVLARTYFAGRDLIGQSITVAHWRTARVIGVVGHVRNFGLGDPGTYNASQIYISFYQLSDPWVAAFARSLSIMVRTPLDAAALMPAVRGAVYSAGKDQPVYHVRTLEQIAKSSMAPQRLPLMLLGVLAGVALVLASVGIYGVVSYSVALRWREIGIRMALGAERGGIFRMVIGAGMRMALGGLAIGIASALMLVRVLSSFSQLLFGVRASDPLTFFTVSLVLMCAALLACWIPARRAMQADPVRALRAE